MNENAQDAQWINAKEAFFGTMGTAAEHAIKR